MGGSHARRAAGLLILCTSLAAAALLEAQPPPQPRAQPAPALPPSVSPRRRRSTACWTMRRGSARSTHRLVAVLQPALWRQHSAGDARLDWVRRALPVLRV